MRIYIYIYWYNERLVIAREGIDSRGAEIKRPGMIPYACVCVCVSIGGRWM